MSKITLPTIESGYLSTEALSTAFSAIEQAFDNTISRDGSTPNQLEADLDLNGHRILNSGAVGDDPEALVTVEQMQEYIDSAATGLIVQRVETQTATASQTTFNIANFEYTIGANNLAVYVDGARKFPTTDYIETDSDTITFLAGLTAGQKVSFVQNDMLGTVEFPVHEHPWAQITGAPTYATRDPTWDEVTGKPSTFTPEAHNQDASTITTGRLADARRGVYVQATQPSSPQVGDLWFW